MFRFFIKLIFDLKAEEQRHPLVLIQSFAAMMQRNRQMMPGQENVTTVPPFRRAHCRRPANETKQVYFWLG